MMFLLAACKSAVVVDDDTTVPDETDAAFAEDRVVEVDITLPAEDWATCRGETRSVWDLFGGDCLAEPFGSPFTWFAGAVTIDGVTFAEAGVRKKGFLGSLDWTRPGLKLRFDKYEEGASYHGMSRIALNNTPQDPTLLETCLAYTVFDRAGLPAPRCSFAHVRVNGEDLGVYSVVEPVDAEFTARRFPGVDGDLYEGTLSDFREGWLGTFEPETEGADSQKLARVIEALEADDDEVMTALAEVVDLEAYLDFWAAESLVGHWDGYNANTNNFYVWDDGKIRFIPWGADSAFNSDEPFGEGMPVWVSANSALSHRIINLPEGREAYERHLAAVMDRAWDEAEMLAELDRAAALIAPYMDSDWEAAVADLRSVVEKRDNRIEKGLDDDLNFSADLRSPPCFREIGSLEASFETTWGSYAEGGLYVTGEMAFEAVFEGEAYTATEGGAIAGAGEDGWSVVMLGGELGEELRIVPYAAMDPAYIEVGTLDFDFVNTTGAVYYMSPETGGDYAFAAYIADGGITFHEVGTQYGDAVRGEMAGRLVAWGW